jgi:hypothetical protein
MQLLYFSFFPVSIKMVVLEEREGILMQYGIGIPPANPKANSACQVKKGISAFFSKDSMDAKQSALIFSTPIPLFRLDKCSEKYSHLLKKKDLINVGPIVNYFINNSEQAAFLAGDVVNNLYLHGKRKYRVINILSILTGLGIEKYSGILNNIISSNDGAFSMGFKYWVKKNRDEGCFRDIAQVRYIIEPRLEGPEKLLFPFRPAAIELDLTTQSRFFAAFGVNVI